MYITTDEWIEKFQPIQNPIEPDSEFDGCQFETSGEELDFVKSRIAENTVWTMIDDDNGTICIINSFHRTNRIGYFVSAIAYNPDEEYNVYEEDDLNQMKARGEI